MHAGGGDDGGVDEPVFVGSLVVVEPDVDDGEVVEPDVELVEVDGVVVEPDVELVGVDDVVEPDVELVDVDGDVVVLDVELVEVDDEVVDEELVDELVVVGVDDDDVDAVEVGDAIANVPEVLVTVAAVDLPDLTSATI